jgi:hypothetical protein
LGASGQVGSAAVVEIRLDRGDCFKCGLGDMWQFPT